MSKTDSKILSDYLSRSIAQQQDLIKLADTKANIVLALIGVVASLFFNFFVTKGVLSTVQILLVLAFMLISGFFSFLTLYPRRSKNSDGDSLLYFKQAKNIDQRKLLNRLKENAEEKIILDYLDNIKSVSCIVEKKFNYLRYSYIFLAISLLTKLIIEFYSWTWNSEQPMNMLEAIHTGG